MGTEGIEGTGSHVALTMGVFTPHRPYFVTLPDRHNADDGSSKAKNYIDDYLG